MAKEITFEESLGVEPEEFTLPLIRGCENELVVYVPDNSSNTIIIPESVEVINRAAFAQCDVLSRVVILNPETMLSTLVFYGCNQLKEVELGDVLYPINEKGSLIRPTSDEA